MTLKLRARQAAIASLKSAVSLSRSVTKYWRTNAVQADTYSTFYRFRPGSISLGRIELQNEHLLLRFLGPTGEPIATRLTVNGAPVEGIELPKSPEPHRYDYSVTVATEQNSSAGSMSLVYFPRAIYVANGNSGPGQIVVLSSDFPISKTARVSPQHYDDADLAWARHEWPVEGRTDIERAEAITVAILKKVSGHVGIPSDQIGSNPREQYGRALRGLDEVWCDQLAQILHLGFTGHGIESRIIRTGSDCQILGENCFLAMNSHATLEYYSRETNGWVWTDPSAAVLSAAVDSVPLNLNQVIQALDTPLEDRIAFRCFDDASGVVLSKDRNDKRIQRHLSDYLRPGVKLTF